MIIEPAKYLVSENNGESQEQGRSRLRVCYALAIPIALLVFRCLDVGGSSDAADPDELAAGGFSITGRFSRNLRKRDERADAADTDGGSDGGTGDDDDEEEEELPPCGEVLLRERTRREQCNCARSFITPKLLPMAFCDDGDGTNDPFSTAFSLAFLVLASGALVLSTLLLFRLLSSTAENFFSPALEMLSTEIGLPPRLAGVTLLALGNGAPDVSAVYNAIKTNPGEGTQLSLGELTGGGIFVQSIVVARIIFINNGANCNADLTRDIFMYAMSASYVFWICSKGVVTYRDVVGMFALYGCYVTIVFAVEARRMHLSRDGSHMKISGKEGDSEAGEDHHTDDEEISLLASPSNDPEEYALELAAPQCLSKDLPTAHTGAQISRDPLLSQRGGFHDPPGEKYSSRIARIVGRKRQRSVNRRKSVDAPCSTEPAVGQEDFGSKPFGVSDRMWSIELFMDALKDVVSHFREVLYDEIVNHTENSKFEKICLAFELPFTVARNLVIPIPCGEDYRRSMVALSMACSPLWICFYVSTKVEDYAPFHLDSNGQPPPAVWPCLVSFTAGALVLRYASNDSMPLLVAVPIALYGFVIAASWIDLISDQLVSLLEFIGVICRIPSPIMGMTVLAWGNSIGDFTTNAALARKGLADMSMSACFAGPSFNLLIGLGSGFLSKRPTLESGGLSLSLMPSVRMGFIFSLSNCFIAIAVGLWHRGHIPTWHGYVCYAMYFAYMTMNAEHLLL